MVSESISVLLLPFLSLLRFLDLVSGSKHLSYCSAEYKIPDCVLITITTIPSSREGESGYDNFINQEKPWLEELAVAARASPK